MRQSWIKTIRAFFVPLLALMLSACQTDDFQVPHTGPHEVGFYAGGSTQTRTEMLPNGLSAVWTAGDELAVWAKNSSGVFTLSNQIFKTYGIDGRHGFFTSTLSEAMPDDTYTYYCTYPVPKSVDGTNVTFNIPAVQDGKVSGGADIMIAEPVQRGALTPVPDPENHSGMSMEMNRMLHQFRFYVPDGISDLGEDINEIYVTMPDPVVGTVSADLTSPGNGLVLSGGSDMFVVNLSDGLPLSPSAADIHYACAAICPSDKVYTDSDYMNITIYSQSYKAVLDPISLADRQFLAGHSTPVRMMLPTHFDEYYRLTMNVGDNHIGEPLAKVTISFDGEPWYTFGVTGADQDGNFTHVVEALNAEGKDAYELIIDKIDSGKATYIYETDHAFVNRPLTSDMMTYDGNSIVLELGDVPYLLYEDFATAKAIAHDDDYSPGLNDDQNLKGYLLNGYMPIDGWNAARFSIIEGDFIRINCRYQSGAWVVGRYCGRLDTPALKYLKSDANVDVVVEFDEAFSIPTGLGVDDVAYTKARYKVGYHTKSESSAINSVTSNNVNGNSTIINTTSNLGNQSLLQMAHQEITIKSAGQSTRVVFYADTEYSKSTLASNLVYYLYLDNIKVYIKNKEK